MTRRKKCAKQNNFDSGVWKWASCHLVTCEIVPFKVITCISVCLLRYAIYHNLIDYSDDHYYRRFHLNHLVTNFSDLRKQKRGRRRKWTTPITPGQNTAAVVTDIKNTFFFLSANKSERVWRWSSSSLALWLNRIEDAQMFGCYVHWVFLIYHWHEEEEEEDSNWN